MNPFHVPRLFVAEGQKREAKDQPVLTLRAVMKRLLMAGHQILRYFHSHRGQMDFLQKGGTSTETLD